MRETLANSTDVSEASAKRAIRIVFVTLVVDLIGFSIVFPLYPGMLTYYLEREGHDGILGSLIAALEQFDAMSGGGVVVLFGGFLGSAYAILQFVFAPIFGTLSDRFGRKPVLIASLTGISISYLLWVVAGQFWVLLLARFIGGVMSSSISTATAVVADVTPLERRSRGMAIVGMAIGIGFMGGPAIGGLAGSWNWAAQWPAAAAWGINPYSFPAALAAALALFNLFFIVTRFQETRRQQPVDARIVRTANPLALFRMAEYPGVARTNWIYFIFLAAFSGMEFSVTFLAADRFGFGPGRLGLMLLYAGVILAVTQGAYVRRRADVIGPRRMAGHGLLCAIPALVIIGSATAPWMAFVGLGLMAVGSAQVMPCLTALVSTYAPANDQGRVLGVFRSLGGLARAVGPIAACVVYWRLGSDTAYYAVACLMLLPFLLTKLLPDPKLVKNAA